MNKTNYTQWLKAASAELDLHSDSPRIDAQVLLQAVSKRSLAWLIAHGDEVIPDADLEPLNAALRRRMSGEPIAYITGTKEFWSMELEVDQNVLVPRADTETLVESALARVPKHGNCRVADLGTGSGAVALAIAKERPEARIVAFDISTMALNIAQRNALKHELSNIEFIQSDWLLAAPQDGFDLIVSNPPYVRSDDPHLKQGDLRSEPDLALIGKEDGLGDIRLIVDQARAHLRGAKFLMIEHGSEQAEAVEQIFKHHGFADIACQRDINGLDRCTSGRLK